MKRTPIYQVDAFTTDPFHGNPAGVCILTREMPDSWMQQVAGEMNVAETAFVRQTGESWSLRWFTPVAEVDLCGHATLATAHVLWSLDERYDERYDALRFDTRSGRLTAVTKGSTIELDFPVETPTAATPSTELVAALGNPQITWSGANRMDTLVEVSSEEIVRSLQPDMNALAGLPTRGIIVTAKSTSADFDFVSRFFAPRLGIPEDPVTGSAHCALAPFWAERLAKMEMRGYQASPRGGIVGVRVNGERVVLIGQAVTVIEGTLLA